MACLFQIFSTLLLVMFNKSSHTHPQVSQPGIVIHRRLCLPPAVCEDHGEFLR